MKCGFCGNELENGAQFCPNCGMIISLGEENDTAQENDAVVESVYNVFKSNIEKETEQKETAKELEADPTEEKVEFVMSLPEFEDYAAEPIKAPEHIELPDHSVIRQEPKAEEEAQEEVIEEAVEAPTEEPDQEVVEETAEEAKEETTEEAAEEAVEDVTEAAPEENSAEEPMEDIYSYSSEDIKEQDETVEAEPLDIRVPEMNVIYAGPEKAPEPIEVSKTAPKNEELRRKKQAKEKISPDKKEIKQKPKKTKKKGVDGIKIEGVLGVAVAVILVLFACVYAVKNDKIPVLGQLFGNDNTTESQPSGNSEWTESRPEEFIGENGKKIYADDEGNYYYYDDNGVTYSYVVPNTEDSTSEEDTTESTTEESTTEEDTTESTTEETTTETTTESTTKPTTTKPTTTKPTTTKPTTTKPTTTKPTTTKPTTTKPTTRPVTNPSTTKPTTTDKFGINDVTVKKPASYLSKSYTGYVTAEGVNLRSKPTTESDRVLYLSKGADVVVLAKENGFFYIKSNRYGVYGWVSSSYISTSRPQSESVVQKGTVSPDKKYATAEIKYTTNGLNVRKGPSTSYDIVGLVPISYPVKVIGYKLGVSGWVYVQDTTYGYTGWVSTAYLK